MNKLVSIIVNKVMLIALVINVVIVMISQSNLVSFELLLVINAIFIVYITNQKLDTSKIIIVYLYAQLMVAVVTIMVVTQSLLISLIGLWLICYCIPRLIIKQLKPGRETKKNIAIALLANIVMTIVMSLHALTCNIKQFCSRSIAFINKLIHYKRKKYLLHGSRSIVFTNKLTPKLGLN